MSAAQTPRYLGIAAKGLLIATSNLPESLDVALWRRFDLAIEFPKPIRAALARFARGRQKTYGLSLSPKLLQQVNSLPSFSDAARFIEDEARLRALSQSAHATRLRAANVLPERIPRTFTRRERRGRSGGLCPLYPMSPDVEIPEKMLSRLGERGRLRKRSGC